MTSDAKGCAHQSIFARARPRAAAQDRHAHPHLQKEAVGQEEELERREEHEGQHEQADQVHIRPHNPLSERKPLCRPALDALRSTLGTTVATRAAASTPVDDESDDMSAEGSFQSALLLLLGEVASHAPDFLGARDRASAVAAAEHGARLCLTWRRAETFDGEQMAIALGPALGHETHARLCLWASVAGDAAARDSTTCSQLAREKPINT